MALEDLVGLKKSEKELFDAIAADLRANFSHYQTDSMLLPLGPFENGQTYIESIMYIESLEEYYAFIERGPNEKALAMTTFKIKNGEYDFRFLGHTMSVGSRVRRNEVDIWLQQESSEDRALRPIDRHMYALAKKAFGEIEEMVLETYGPISED